MKSADGKRIKSWLPFLLIIWLQRAYAFRNLIWDDWALVLDRFPGPDLTPKWLPSWALRFVARTAWS